MTVVNEQSGHKRHIRFKAIPWCNHVPCIFGEHGDVLLSVSIEVARSHRLHHVRGFSLRSWQGKSGSCCKLQATFHWTYPASPEQDGACRQLRVL